MQNTNTQYQKRDWDNQEAGVIWKRKTKAGQDMLTGKVTINGTQFEFVCFTNKNKYNKDTGELIDGKDKLPDFRIYPSEPRDVVSSSVPKTTSTPITVKKTTSRQSESVVIDSDNDII